MKEYRNTEKKIIDNRPVEYIEISSFPRNLMLSLTSLCNHKCIMCTHNTPPPPPIKKIFMPLEKVKTFLNEAYKLGTRDVGFYIMGEPFLSKDLENAVLEAKSTGYEYIYLTTNGSLAVKDRVNNLFLNGLNSIKFSLNAANPETYKKVHGKNDFDKVIMNIIDADNIRKRLKLDIGIFVSFIEMEINKGQADILNIILKDSIDYLYIKPLDNMGGSMSIDNQDKKYSYTRSKCILPFDRFCITPEGYLNACCVDLYNYLAYADLNNTSIEEAWSNVYIKELRNHHINGTIPITSKCYNCLYNTNEKVEPIIRELCCNCND